MLSLEKVCSFQKDENPKLNRRLGKIFLTFNHEHLNEIAANYKASTHAVC